MMPFTDQTSVQDLKRNLLLPIAHQHLFAGIDATCDWFAIFLIFATIHRR